MVKFLVRTVATGFALSLGAALYKKAAKKLGLDENDKKTEQVNQQDAATDPPHGDGHGKTFAHS